MDAPHHPQAEPPRGSFWKTRTGIVLLAFLAIALLMLTYEHRVHLFAGNAGLLMLVLACGVMHLFMHRGHRRHGSGPGGGDGK